MLFEVFVEIFVVNGVIDMFGIMGFVFMDVMDIFVLVGICLILVVYEQGVGYMVDGYVCVLGCYGVVIGQNGFGISNCVIVIVVVYWVYSLVVIVMLEVGMMGIGFGGFQEVNQLLMFQEFMKYQGYVMYLVWMVEFIVCCFDCVQVEMGLMQLNILCDYFYGKVKVEIL